MVKPISVAVSLFVLFFAFAGASGAAADSGATKAAPSATAALPANDTLQKTSATAAPASAKPAALQNKKPVEEDLEEELLPEEGTPEPARAEPAVPAAAAAKTDTASTKAATVQNAADTSKAAGAAPVHAVAGAAAETAKPAPIPVVGASAADTTKKGAVAQKTSMPVRIEEARPINFARNLKDYRSPKLAMLMSLIIPGLGQAYVKSYLKAGLFVAAEAAIITASVVYMNKGKDRYNQATAFADRNYSVSNMQSYYSQLLSFLQGVYGDSAALDTLYNTYYDTLTSPRSNFIQGKGSHAYYEELEQAAYVQGWKDCKPSLGEITSVSPGAALPNRAGYTRDTTNSLINGSYLVDINGSPVYGYSDSMLAFKAMMSQSNSDYKTATNILFIILVNHVVSAVDALISAKVYNDELLGKQSFWRHIELDPSVAAAGTLSGPAMSLRIKF